MTTIIERQIRKRLKALENVGMARVSREAGKHKTWLYKAMKRGVRTTAFRDEIAAVLGIIPPMLLEAGTADVSDLRDFPPPAWWKPRPKPKNPCKRCGIREIRSTKELCDVCYHADWRREKKIL